MSGDQNLGGQIRGIQVLEPFYTPEEIATAWKLSPDKIRRLFECEPGVLVLENNGAFSKRRYRTLRIPESVVERVYRRLSAVRKIPLPARHK